MFSRGQTLFFRPKIPPFWPKKSLKLHFLQNFPGLMGCKKIFFSSWKSKTLRKIVELGVPPPKFTKKSVSKKFFNPPLKLNFFNFFGLFFLMLPLSSVVPVTSQDVWGSHLLEGRSNVLFAAVDELPAGDVIHHFEWEGVFVLLLGRVMLI